MYASEAVDVVGIRVVTVSIPYLLPLKSGSDRWQVGAGDPGDRHDIEVPGEVQGRMIAGSRKFSSR